MSPKPYLYVSGLIFAVVAVLHGARLLQGWEVQLAGSTIPLSVSWAGLLVAGALAIWALTLARRH